MQFSGDLNRDFGVLNIRPRARHYFFFFVAALAFRATDRAIATACFCGRPDFISVLMFDEMDFCE